MRIRHLRRWTSRPAVVVASALVLTACSAPAASPSRIDRTVELTMTEQLTFEPTQIEVRRGETISFSIRNLDDEGHEAFIGTEEEQRLHAIEHSGLPLSEQAEVTHVMAGRHVAPFGTRVIEYAFQDPDLDEIVIGCHYPGHYEAGMRVVITVVDG